jgi:hypothetical protein
VAFDFDEQQAISETQEAHALIITHLTQLFPAALTIRKAARGNDKLGADYWIEFPHGQFRSVDAKVRRENWRAKDRPEIALEIWSDIKKKKPGWTLDTDKISEYVLFVWLDTGRADLFDFRLLQAVTRANLSEWESARQQSEQVTASRRGKYTARCVFMCTSLDFI